MVRCSKASDTGEIAEIWLAANLEAHDFIPAQYWKHNFAAVKEQLSQAELYVYENAGQIQGFVGLDGSYIAGIFVRSTARSGGIGKQLLDAVKAIRTELSLSVYQRNIRAVSFYWREGFAIHQKGIDENTHEPEYVMTWKRTCPNRANVPG